MPDPKAETLSEVHPFSPSRGQSSFGTTVLGLQMPSISEEGKAQVHDLALTQYQLEVLIALFFR